MKSRIFLLLVFVLACCWVWTASNPSNARTFAIISGSAAEIVRIDGCQYLKTYVHGGYALAHKGDCDNPVHRTK